MIDMEKKQMSRVTSLFPGDKIAYECAAGSLTGVVKYFYLSLNGLNELIPWVVIDLDNEDLPSYERSATLCATPGNLAMMKVRLRAPEEVYG